MKFSWDPRKAEANLRKHGVSFEEALTVAPPADEMRSHYDFDNTKSRPNRFAKRFSTESVVVVIEAGR